MRGWRASPTLHRHSVRPQNCLPPYIPIRHCRRWLAAFRHAWHLETSPRSSAPFSLSVAGPLRQPTRHIPAGNRSDRSIFPSASFLDRPEQQDDNHVLAHRRSRHAECRDLVQLIVRGIVGEDDKLRFSRHTTSSVRGLSRCWRSLNRDLDSLGCHRSIMRFAFIDDIPVRIFSYLRIAAFSGVMSNSMSHSLGAYAITTCSTHTKFPCPMIITIRFDRVNMRGGPALP